MAYIVKAYDYDGNFYGYAAPHEEGPDFSFYDDNKANAIKFETYADADAYIDKFADGSDLEYIIVNADNNSLETVISDWVEANYGVNEAENPSWNIEALASRIQEYINDKGDD